MVICVVIVSNIVEIMKIFFNFMGWVKILIIGISVNID